MDVICPPKLSGEEVNFVAYVRKLYLWSEVSVLVNCRASISVSDRDEHVRYMRHILL